VLYLLDANVLIDAHRDYYPMESVPEFWEWLRHVGEAGHVKIAREVLEEIRDAKQDALAGWAKQDAVETALLLGEDVDINLVRRVTTDGYAPDLTDDEVEKIGRDPFLIAYALYAPEQRCVVTTEVSKPGKQRANRRIPDVCRSLGVRPLHTFEFLRELKFSTRWRTAAAPAD
jgi:hypothetical protein